MGLLMRGFGYGASAETLGAWRKHIQSLGLAAPGTPGPPTGLLKSNAFVCGMLACCGAVIYAGIKRFQSVTKARKAKGLGSVNQSQLYAHDVANFLVLGAYTFVCLGVTFGKIKPVRIVAFFTAYNVADICWMFCSPGCVPRAPEVLIHHVFSLALVSMPLRYPELQVLVAWGTLLEVNTMLLCGRRSIWTDIPAWLAKVDGAVYWSTFVLTRFVFMAPQAVIWALLFIVEGHAGPMDAGLFMLISYLLVAIQFRVMWVQCGVRKEIVKEE